MTTTPAVSYADWLALYARDVATTETIATARLRVITGAVLAYIGWRENDAGVRTLASSAHTVTIPSLYGLRDSTRLTLPLAPVTAVTDVRAGDDVGGTSGVDYTALVSGTDYRLDLSDPRSPALRWLGGEPAGEEVRVTMTAGWATVPEDLQGLVGELTSWSLKTEARRGKTSASDGQTASTGYRPEEWPPDLLARLAPYVCPPARVVRR
jgi:hypothetical protein